MHLEKVKNWWKPENATVSILDLIGANVLVKLSSGLTFILSPVGRVMLKIQSVASATQSRARATIARRTIEQIKPVQFTINNPNIAIGYAAFQHATSGQYNTALGYQAGYSFAGSGLHINKTNPNHNSIQFNNRDSKPVLVITQDGDVEWHGKPSEAAEALTRTFQFAVEDMKGVTKAARRRYYHRACKNILNKAEKMEHEEFLDFLRKQVYNKERRVIVDALQGKV
jgi:hypothetical protein